MVRPAAFLLLPLALGACETVEAALGPAAAVQIGATMVMGRGPGEALYSLVTGRDCSLANYAAEKRFCAQEEVPRAPQYCTRSLGWVDCWTVSDPYGPQRGVAETATPPPQRDRTWISLRRPTAELPPETPRQPSE